MGTSGRMTSARRRKIIDELAIRGLFRVADLAEFFQVSEITVRRDLDELAEQGLVERFHGGARLVAPRSVTLGASATSHDAEKRAIAQAAARHVRPGDTVLLSGGTTTLAVFREIAKMDIRVVTNNAMIVSELGGDTTAELFVVGGEYNRKTRALNGDLTNMTLNQIHGTICFLGTNAISHATGLTSQIHAAAAVNRLMATQCKGNVVVVADASKVGTTAHFSSLPLSDVRVLITDEAADPAELAAYRTSGMEVIACSIDRRPQS